jgi:MscS family membrane protein
MGATRMPARPLVADRRVAAIVLLALAVSIPAAGQFSFSPPGSASSPTPTPAEPAADPYGRETPHGCFFGFLHAAEKGNYELAATFLQIPASMTKEREEIARQVQVVFDHRLDTSRLDLVSRNPLGSEDDALGPGRERVAELRVENGRVDVVLVRVEELGAPPIWQISWETLRECRRIYRELDVPDIGGKLPGFLTNIRVGAMPLWQVATFVLLLPLLFAVSWLVVTLVFALVRLVRRRQTAADTSWWAPGARSPATALLTLLLHRTAVEWLGMPALYRLFYNRILAVLFFLGLYWLLSRLVDALDRRVISRFVPAASTARHTTLTLVRRTLKLLAFVVVFLIGLASFGVNLTATLAGLGIGGLVLAFAAQKSLENLFGGVAVLTDRALGVGDTCRIAGGQQGEVEDITLWATRIRTQERTVLSIPNGSVMAAQIENISRRDKFWFHPVVGLDYATTATQLEQVLAGLRAMLAGEPRVQTRDARVQLVRLGASSLDIEVSAYVRAADSPTFQAIQEELLLKTLRIVEETGTSLAFPSQSVYLRSEAPDRGSVGASTPRSREADVPQSR